MKPGFSMRRLSPDDAEQFYRLYDDPAVNGGDVPFIDGETASAFLRRIQDACVVHLGIFPDSEPGLLIGDCALHDHEPERGCIEIGGALLPGYQGRGIMRQAFRDLIRHAAQHLGVRQLIGRTGAENAAAIRLVESLGFRSSVAEDAGVVLILNLE